MPYFQPYGAGATERVELYTLAEVAELFHLSRNTVSRYVNTGRLPACSIGRKKYVSKANVLAYLNGARTWGNHTGYYRRTHEKMETPFFQKSEFRPAYLDNIRAGTK